MPVSGGNSPLGICRVETRPTMAAIAAMACFHTGQRRSRRPNCARPASAYPPALPCVAAHIRTQGSGPARDAETDRTETGRAPSQYGFQVAPYHAAAAHGDKTCGGPTRHDGGGANRGSAAAGPHIATPHGRRLSNWAGRPRLPAEAYHVRGQTRSHVMLRCSARRSGNRTGIS